MERWLAENGYRIAFRRDGWVECLAIRENERWVGRGDDDAGAMADLVAAMFPSHASRVALETLLRASEPVPAPKPAPVAAPPVTPVELALKAVAPVAQPVAVVAPPPPPAPAKEPPKETRREEREEPDR